MRICFYRTRKKSDGTVTIKKHFNRKYKLTNERILKIEKVITQKVTTDNVSGVCTNCFKQIERVIKNENEIAELKAKLNDSFSSVNKSFTLNLPSTRRQVITKRMLRSPASWQVSKKQPLIAPITVHHAVNILPFVGLTDKPSTTLVNPFAVQLPMAMGTYGDKATVKRSLAFDTYIRTCIPSTLIVHQQKEPKVLFTFDRSV